MLLFQCFSTFFDSMHPFMIQEEFGSTPCFDFHVNKCEKKKFGGTPVAFTAPKGTVAPRMRTTVFYLRPMNYLFVKFFIPILKIM